MKRHQSTKSTVCVSISKLKPGPMIHPPFTEERRERVRYIQSTFAEVQKLTTTEWELDFRRDLDPEPEIEFWTDMARAYSLITSGQNFTLNQKNEVHTLLLMHLAGFPIDDGPRQWLSADEVQFISDVYAIFVGRQATIAMVPFG